MAIYLQIRLLAAPAALANMVILGWLLGVQDAKSPLYLLLLGNGLNMVLDVLFVLGLGFEVAGVAWATVIAEYTTLALGLWFVHRRFGRVAHGISLQVLLDRAAVRRLVAVNGDIVLRSLVMQVAFVSLVALGSRQGEVILAANTVLANMLHLSAYALDGFAFAASTLVGRHVGAGDRRAMQDAVRAALVWSLGFALGITLLFALGGGALIRLITDIEAVRAAALVYLPYAIAGPLIGAIAFAFDGIYVRRHPDEGDAQRHARRRRPVRARSTPLDPAVRQSRALARLSQLHDRALRLARRRLLAAGARFRLHGGANGYIGYSFRRRP